MNQYCETIGLPRKAFQVFSVKIGKKKNVSNKNQ